MPEKRKILNLCAILLLAISFCGCSKNELAEYKQSRLLLGTYVSITVLSNQGLDTYVTLERAFSEIARLEKLLSSKISSSEIFEINNRGDKQNLKLAKETFYVIKKALKIAKISNGAFDITIVPLISYWEQCVQNDELPKKDVLKEKMSSVGYEKIILDERKRRIQLEDQKLKIELGGIAKGYIVDKAIKTLREEKGIENAMIDAGGDIYCLGRNIKDIPWQVGIQNPQDKKDIVEILSLENKAVATSGNYERFFSINNKNYSHIIDPKTGWPVDDVVSVTIVASSCLTADALATAVTVLGSRQGLELIENTKSVEGLIISNRPDKKLKLATSSGLKKYVSSNY